MFRLLLKFIRAVLMGGLLATVFGCASPPEIEYTVSAEKERIGNTKTVYGRIAVSDPSGERSWEGSSCATDIIFNCPDVFRVVLFDLKASVLNDEMPVGINLKGDGSFTWDLPAGKYMIIAFEYEKWGRGKRDFARTGQIGAFFEVTEKSDTVYVGTLLISLTSDTFRVGTRDDSNNLEFASNLPEGTRFTKQIFKFENVPDGSRVIDICNPWWGLDCDKEHQGVIAISPKSVDRDFHPVENLSPSFSWHPTSREGITYDFVIYPALLYKHMGFGRTYVPGPIHEWAIDLKEPSYKLENPLQPSQKYFWSVRMRDKDSVSNWSTVSFHSSYFLVLMYGSKTGQGVLFNFQTP